MGVYGCFLGSVNMCGCRGGSESHDAKPDHAWTGGRLVRIGREWTMVRFASPGWGWWAMASTRNDEQYGKPACSDHIRLGHRTHKALGRKRVAVGFAVPMRKWVMPVDGRISGSRKWTTVVHDVTVPATEKTPHHVGLHSTRSSPIMPRAVGVFLSNAAITSCHRRSFAEPAFVVLHRAAIACPCQLVMTAIHS